MSEEKCGYALCITVKQITINVAFWSKTHRKQHGSAAQEPSRGIAGCSAQEHEAVSKASNGLQAHLEP